MLLRFTLGFALSWSSMVIQAQPWQNIYFGGISGRCNLIELPSQNILVQMVYSNAVNATGYTLLDAEGNFLQSHSYAVDTLLVVQAVEQLAPNEFLFTAGYRKGACGAPPSMKIHPFIGRMDSLGNFLSGRYYPLNTPECLTSANYLEVMSDGGALVWGKNNSFFVLRTDVLGEVAWARTFGFIGGFRFIKELPSGDLLAGFDLDAGGACVARLDADGNFLWCKSYMRPWGRMHDVVIESDSAFVISGYAGTPSDPKLFMMKLDDEGSVQWCRGYDSFPNRWYVFQWSRIERTLDDNYAVVATLGQASSGFEYRPFLMKTDTNGDTLWTRSVGAQGYTYQACDLLVHSDGGYLFNGVAYGNLPDMWTAAPFIFKTDSLGHFACSERVHPIQVLDLFPTDSSITLNSIDGASAYPAFVVDTVHSPIAVYDACDAANTLNPNIPRPRGGMSIRPNPNTGHFTLAFPDPLMAQSYYSVYDAVGKLLYQRPLPTGATVSEVDLSRFGAGTYVIKLTQPEGACYERVVVE